MESFRIVLKVFGQSEKFPDSWKSFRTVWIGCGQSGKFWDSPVIFWTGVRWYETIYAVLYMSWERFTHFWHTCRGKNLRTSSGKFLRVKVCRPESWDFLGLCIKDGTGRREKERIGNKESNVFKYKTTLNGILLEDLSTQTVTRVVVDIPSGGFPPHSRPSLQSCVVIVIIIFVIIVIVMIGRWFWWLYILSVCLSS